MISRRLLPSWLTAARYSPLDVFFFLALALAVSSCWAGYKDKQVRDVMFQSPLPQKRLAQERETPDDHAYQRNYEFSTDWFSRHIPVWERALAPYRGQPGLRYLEIGVYEGRSAIWMLENVLTDPTSKLTAVDLFDGSYRDRFIANVERANATQRVELIAGTSQVVLRRLPLNSFDIIYIDGSHAKKDVLEDAVLSARLLKNGGIMIFDDYQWARVVAEESRNSPDDYPKAAIDPFVQCFSSEFEVVHNGYQLIIKKESTVQLGGAL